MSPLNKSPEVCANESNEARRQDEITMHCDIRFRMTTPHIASCSLIMPTQNVVRPNTALRSMSVSFSRWASAWIFTKWLKYHVGPNIHVRSPLGKIVGARGLREGRPGPGAL